MDITFRTLGPWGAGKGANLQPSEVDSNFWSIAQAIVDLQNSPALPVGIEAITVSGTQMTITLNDGSVLGPYTLPVLTFRWRDEWQDFTTYAALDVFKVTGTGIFLVQIGHTSGSTFDPLLTDTGGAPVLLQLFGSVDAALSGLSDVEITDLAIGDALIWSADNKWENEALGSMAFQDSNAVAISGGSITGMPTPVNPSDVATKAYADALPAGATAPDATMLANISGATNSPAPHTLSDYLDYVFNTTNRGCIIIRSGSGWIAMQPGANGQYLQTLGAGLDPAWVAGTAGVVGLYAGTGIDLGSLPITSTGTIALAALPDGDILANISGASAAPVPTTLAQWLDHIFGTSRGQLITRTVAGWTALGPGSTGQYLKTQGVGADLTWDSPAGAGTVTSVAAGTGISTGGSPITATGTVALATIADSTMLANVAGSTAAPLPTTFTALLDHVLSSTQGSVIYRSATGWVALAPGTNGQLLTTGGSAANPSWQNPPIGASIANLRIVSNISGSTAAPAANTLSSLFDAIVSSARGTMFYRTNSGWVGLAPGTAGQVLTTGGVSSDPHWVAASAADLAGLGDVTITSPADQDQLTFIASAAKWENKTLSSVIDAALSSTRGTVLYRGASAWSALIPGTSGQVLTTGGSGADPAWAAAAAGLPSISDAQIMANVSGASAVAIGNTLTAILDHIVGNTRGAILERGSTGWSSISPGRSAYYALAANGVGADPSYRPFGGYKWHQVATLATTANIPGTMALGSSGGTIGGTTYTTTANGPVTIDGSTMDGIGTNFGIGTRVLFTSQTTQTQNLLWALSTIGTVSTPSVFTLASDFDDTAYFGGGDIVAVGAGTVNSDSIWMSQVSSGFTLGSSAVTWILVAGRNVLSTLVGAKYNIGCYVPGVPTASQNLLFHKFSKAVTIPANFGTYLGHTSEAGAATAATASTAIDVAKAVAASPTSFSTVGTITFAAAGASATFASTGGTSISFAQGDVLRLRAPATPDATLADFFSTLVGYET